MPAPPRTTEQPPSSDCWIARPPGGVRRPDQRQATAWPTTRWPAPLPSSPSSNRRHRLQRRPPWCGSHIDGKRATTNDIGHALYVSDPARCSAVTPCRRIAPDADPPDRRGSAVHGGERPRLLSDPLRDRRSAASTADRPKRSANVRHRSRRSTRRLRATFGHFWMQTVSDDRRVSQIACATRAYCTTSMRRFLENRKRILDRACGSSGSRDGLDDQVVCLTLIDTPPKMRVERFEHATAARSRPTATNVQRGTRFTLAHAYHPRLPRHQGSRCG